LAVLEKKLDVLQPQWSADFNVLKEQINSALTNMQIKISEEQNSLKQSVNATQNKISTQTQAALAGNARNIKEESVQRCESTKELQNKINDVSQVLATLSNLKEEITGEYKSFMGEFHKSLEQHYITPSQQSDGLSEIKAENEKSTQEMEARLDEVRASLISERNLHLKWMGEERAAFKKSHDEHMRCVEVERDARLRQASELRSEFVKLITKEREDRVIDASVRRSEVDRAKQSIKAMNSGLSSGSSFTSVGAGTFETNTLITSPLLKSSTFSFP